MRDKLYNYSFNFFLKKKIFFPKNILQLKKFVKNKSYSIVGNLRSYNDAAIGKNPVSIRNFRKIINFNPQKKIVEVEAGILLSELLEIILKHNLLIKRMPGSKYVTIGGMLANNTQGKIIHEPFIINNIISFKLLRNGKIFRCSRYQNKSLFFLTIGGKGYSGIIISVVLKLDKIKSDSIVLKKDFFNNPKHLIDKYKNIKYKNEYIVAWADNLSENFNGIIFYSNHIKKNIKIKRRKEIKIPNLILLFLNTISFCKIFTQIFNLVFKINNLLRKRNYYNVYDFFFIQDTILNWNYTFKKYGFFQFQYECDINNLNETLQDLKKIMNKNNFFSNFMVIKFIETKTGTNCTISLDITKKNYKKITRILNNFVIKRNLLVSLSKDSILTNINKKTKSKNLFLNKQYLKFRDKNVDSKFLKRLIGND